jgi:hypothetical protein
MAGTFCIAGDSNLAIKKFVNFNVIHLGKVECARSFKEFLETCLSTDCLSLITR